MMYTNQTKQGYEIVAKLQVSATKLSVVVKRGNDYAWGSYYNEETGSWAQGHYDYANLQDAIEDMVATTLNKRLIEEDQETVEEFIKTFGDELANEDIFMERGKADDSEFRDELFDRFENRYMGCIESAYNRYEEKVD